MSYHQYRPLNPNELPLVTKNIIIINVLLYIFSHFIISNIDIGKYLNLYYFSLPSFKPHQLITHMFMHANIGHILFNMIGLYIFGANLENLWGPKRFLNFYLVCGLAAAFAQIIFCYVSNTPSIMLGASGAIAGLMGASWVLFPNTEISFAFFPIPFKLKYFVPLYIFISWYSGYNAYYGDNTAHFAHIGGLLTGAIIVLIWNKTNRNSFY